MIKTLKESFENLDYCYYVNKSTISLNFNTFSDNNTKKFIKDYFDTGGKEMVISDIYKAFKNHSVRATHSVSAYLIGLIAFERYSTSINNHIFQIEIEDFIHIWFLICLYHDYGYYLEDKAKDGNKIDSEKLKSIYENIKEIDQRFWGTRYSSGLILEYFIDIRNKADHGVIAGAMLRKRMNENLQKAIKDSNCNNPNNFIWRNLHWSTSHKKWYDFASSIIIKHNIWFANSNHDASRVEQYNNSNHLKRLIISDEERLKFKEDPILFILCVIDTIEPIKIAQKLNIDYIKDKNYTKYLNRKVIAIVSIVFENNNIIIKLPSEHELLYNRIHDSAEGMQSWLNLSVSQSKENNILSTIIEWA